MNRRAIDATVEDHSTAAPNSRSARGRPPCTYMIALTAPSVRAGPARRAATTFPPCCSEDDVREIVELFHKALDESILGGDARII